MPNCSKCGRRNSIQFVSLVPFETAGRWQNTLTLNGRSHNCRTDAIIRRASAAGRFPTPMDPKPPAIETAAAISGVDTPAIGRLNDRVLDAEPLEESIHIDWQRTLFRVV